MCSAASVWAEPKNRSSVHRFPGDVIFPQSPDFVEENVFVNVFVKPKKNKEK